MKYNIVADYVADLQSGGRYTFTRDEVQKALSLSGLALKRSLERLSKKKSIVLVHRGFYIIVPLEYRARGILPPEWFIRDLMQFMKLDYYVALLSAAAVLNLLFVDWSLPKQLPIFLLVASRLSGYLW